jgi:hypothetical protein
MTVSDDVSGRPQWSPSLSIQPCGSYGVVNVVWQDPRHSPAATPARFSDVYFAQKVALTGYGWSRNTRLSNRSSLAEMRSDSDVYSINMRSRVAASGASIVAAWTDRRDKTNIDDRETDIYSSRVVTGVSCP